MRVCISGAIGSDVPGTTPESRRQAFHDMDKRLVEAGHEPCNPLHVLACSPIPGGACGTPVDPTDEQSHSWLCYLKYDIRAMMLCDAVVALNGADQSKGAIVEVGLAKALDMPVFQEFPNGLVMQVSGHLSDCFRLDI